jgi:flagellar hook-length control protein FliK
VVAAVGNPVTGSPVPTTPLDPAATAATAAAAPTLPTSTDADDATGTAATGAVPGSAAPAPAATTGDQASADPGDSGQNGSTPPPAADTILETPAAGPVPAPAPATSTATSGATSTGDAASLPAGSQVARHVATLRGAPDGRHTMTLVLTPETLGPVEVQVTVSKGAVDLTLRGAHEHGRAALLDSLPDLRRDLETAGLTCTRLEVDRDTGGARLSQQGSQQQTPQQSQQQGFGERSGSPDRGDRSRPWLRAADITRSGPTPPSQRSTSSGVDVRV